MVSGRAKPGGDPPKNLASGRTAAGRPEAGWMLNKIYDQTMNAASDETREMASETLQDRSYRHVVEAPNEKRNKTVLMGLVPGAWVPGAWE